MCRDTKRHELLRARAVNAARMGANDLELIQIVGIASSTFYSWKNRFPEFSAALDAARIPEGSEELLAKVARRQAQAEKMVDEYLHSGRLETTRLEPDDKGNGYTKTTYRHLPEKWLLERILGASQAEPPREFEVRVSVVDPLEVGDDGEDDELFGV